MRFPATILLALALPAAAPRGAEQPPEMSPGARPVEHDPAAFRPDPTYADRPFDPAAQVAIYGGKRRVRTQRPLLEIGRELYAGGPFRRSGTALGDKNPVQHSLLASGDWRTGVARHDDGANQRSVLATRLNLDLDWQVTATERMHAFFRPFDKNGRFSRIERLDTQGEAQEHATLDGNLDSAFFEGELGAIVAGARGKDSRFELPFAVGLMPLLFQNGVWVEDAFSGLAFTIPARNGRWLDISNMDVTFFAGIDAVDTAAVGPAGRAHVYGLTAFVEQTPGYVEVGYGYVDDRGGDGRHSYHNVALAYTRRYGAALSASVRAIGNLGQDPGPGFDETAHGALLLVETSWITSRPYTFVPYLNLFGGFGEPEPLARAPEAGGVLKNTGILFESDGLTGFPTLEASGHNTSGGALGLEWLFGLERQLVVEVAGVAPHGDPAERVAVDDEYGAAVRFQTPLSHAVILRADGMVGRRSGLTDLWGGRVELRFKF